MRDDAISAELSSTLTSLFEIPPEKIVPEARLYEDLGLDSIDAVDLVLRLQEFTGQRFTPEQFQSVRTVGDVMNVVHEIVGQAQ